jgi:hypothetical protein
MQGRNTRIKRRTAQVPTRRTFATTITLSPRAALAVLTVVAAGRSMPDVLSSVIEDWSETMGL